MTHFVMLLILVLVAYAGWQLGARVAKREPIVRHASRIGVMVLALLGLLALAYYLPATPLL